MTNAVFRCDSSELIGSGHVMRCRRIGLELKEQGARVTFLCKDHVGNMIDYLEQDFTVLALPAEPINERPAHKISSFCSSWLGSTQERDAELCLEKLGDANINDVDLLIVDHYCLDITWEERMRVVLTCNASARLLVIDDLANRDHDADVLVDQNYLGATGYGRYLKRVPKKCRTLVGPNYALIDRQYALLRPSTPRRESVRRVLVFFGGADPYNLTSMAIKALSQDKTADINVDVVIGKQSRHSATIADLASKRKNTQMHYHMPTLAGLIAHSDLAIGSAGSTLWERMSLSLPSLIVSFGHDQQPIAQALHQDGLIEYLGDATSITSRAIETGLAQVISQFEKRADFMQIVDGWGVSRVLMSIDDKEEQLKIRPAEEADKGILFNWANEPQVRINSFSPESISIAEHSRWFNEIYLDPNHLLLIVETSTGCPIGQMRFDLALGDSGGGDPLIAYIDLSLDQCVRGKGLATKAIRLGCAAARKHWNTRLKLVAEVFNTNTPSNKSFENAGFCLECNAKSIGSTDGINTWVSG